MITLYTDFKSPAAYLSLKPTLALIDQYGVDIRWLPYNTKQETLPVQSDTESKSETHFRIRATLRRDTHLRYAETQSSPMIFRDVPGETDSALAALLALDGDPLPFIQSAFNAYWAGEDDLNDGATVHRLLDETGCTLSTEALDDALEKLPAHQLAAEENGVVDAPAYVIDDQIFIGREHLPWIRSLIERQ